MQELPSFHFDTDVIRVTNLLKNEMALAEIRAKSPDAVPQKVLDVYGEVCFPEGYDDRPYTYASIVLSSDGKMAYPDVPQGPVIASSNQLDPDCGKTDFWVLNMLRTYADAVIIGARTLQMEPEATSHIFCEELAKARVEVLKKSPYPINVAISFDGTDVPLEHKIFTSEGLVSMICTSPEGGEFLAKALTERGRAFALYGPYSTADAADADAIKKKMAESPDSVHILTTGTGHVPNSKMMLAILRRLGIQRAMIESPSYMWHLFENKALDEFFINYSMVFAGGDITMGLRQPFTSTSHPHSELLMLGVHKANLICTRQRLHYEFMEDGPAGKQ